MSQGIQFAVVEMATGRIVSAGFGQPEGVSVIAGEGQAVIEAPYPVKYNQHWFDAGEFKELSILEATWDTQTIDADGVDTATLSGPPVPCQVMVDNLVYDVDDGSLELTVEAPGRYYVFVDHPQHFNTGWSIYAS